LSPPTADFDPKLVAIDPRIRPRIPGSGLSEILAPCLRSIALLHQPRELPISPADPDEIAAEDEASHAPTHAKGKPFLISTKGVRLHSSRKMSSTRSHL
jgi:hypothetical protein